MDIIGTETTLEEMKCRVSGNLSERVVLLILQMTFIVEATHPMIYCTTVVVCFNHRYRKNRLLTDTQRAQDSGKKTGMTTRQSIFFAIYLAHCFKSCPIKVFLGIARYFEAFGY